MRVVVDENVSYRLVGRLRELDHEVVSISESATAGISDQDVYGMTVKREAVLITRDYHFTNPIRFAADQTRGIIYIRHGNLTSEEEVAIVEGFLKKYDFSMFTGKLVTLYRHSVRIR
ncbi:MAG: DUF5615 family PIN-like protein [Dehalococcoidia bacterium]